MFFPWILSHILALQRIVVPVTVIVQPRLFIILLSREIVRRLLYSNPVCFFIYSGVRSKYASHCNLYLSISHHYPIPQNKSHITLIHFFTLSFTFPLLKNKEYTKCTVTSILLTINTNIKISLKIHITTPASQALQKTSLENL